MFGLEKGIELEKALRQIQHEQTLDSKRIGNLMQIQQFEVVEEEPEETHYSVN